MKLRTTLLAALLAPTLAYADAAGEAQALFDQGIADFKAGKTEEACRELAASLAKHQDSDTKSALALCTTKQGKIATAWQLWKDLADTAPSPDLRALAQKNGAELEPRLPHYTVKAASTPGLVVTVNDSAIDLGISVPLPIDPGTVKITAKAPGYKDWSGTAQATEGQVTTIDIPALVIDPDARKTPIGSQEGKVVDDSARHSRRSLAVGIAIGGGASLVGSLVFGAVASSKFNSAKQACGGDLDNCPGDQFQNARNNFNTANTTATVSTVLFAIGAAAIAGAAVTWFTAPGVEEHAPQTAWRVAPVIDPHGAGLVLVGGWR